MRLAVRALSVFLTVWLTAAAAFPPCCWSMASAHAHQPAPDSAPTDAASFEHHHDHHGSGDSDAGGTTAVASALPAYDCDAEFADAATTTGGVTRVALRPAPQSAASLVLPTVPGHDAARADLSPPGSTFPSAFLRPLRI